jgi:hypothetical protein
LSFFRGKREDELIKHVPHNVMVHRIQIAEASQTKDGLAQIASLIDQFVRMAPTVAEHHLYVVQRVSVAE